MPDPITLVPTARKASEGVKAVLHKALEFAEKEGCTAVAIAFVTADCRAGISFDMGENVFTLIGAVQQLNSRLLER